MSSKTSSRPTIEFATGQANIKGEDVILVRPRCSFPKSVGSERTVLYKGVADTFAQHDSASSVYANAASSLQDNLALGERGVSKSSSLRGRNSLGSLKGTESYGVFCVFDGHNGIAAAQYLEDSLATTLEEKLPAGNPPPENMEPAFTQWREELQRALVETFCDLTENFACKGQLAGATITVVLQCGSLLTIANSGDSRALLDTGSDHLIVSVDHRIATNQAERHRLEAMNCHIAPIDASGSGPAVSKVGYGPLRVWPGGLCLSRGIGDFDIGPSVIACPHIFQVRVPATGGRLIVASDGLWDGFENMKRLCRMSRSWSCQAAPNKIIQTIQRAYGGLRDDTSVVVLDIMPAGVAFTDIGSSNKRQQGSNKGGCFCFSPGAVMDTTDVSRAPVHAKVYTDLDVAAAAGLMPEKLSAIPSWCDQNFLAFVAGSQESACNAWTEARSMRSNGRNPSRMDLASFFSNVHRVRPLPDSKHTDPHDLDVSTRPDLFGKRQTIDDVTVRPRRETDYSLADAAAAAQDNTPEINQEDHNQNASTRFSEHTAQPQGFARKFGHYKEHMAENPCDEGSTTEDDSQRTGSYANDSYQNLAEKDLQSPRGDGESWSRRSSFEGSPNNRGRSSLQTAESMMSASSVGLATVEEEAGPRRLTPPESLPPPAEHLLGEPASEMAVRRGKNRFITGEL